MERLKGLINSIVNNEVSIAFFALLGTGFILFFITCFFDPDITFNKIPDLGLYNKPDFWENVLVESHGMLLDLFIIGVFIFWLQRRSANALEKKRKIQKHKEEIDDYRGWDEKEAMYRIVGSVKRLNKLDVANINLFDCYLEDANLSGANLQKAYLSGANFQKANLSGANLQKTNLSEANLSEANLQQANLRETEAWKIHLDKANLELANFKNASLYSGSFQETILKKANFDKAFLENSNFDKANLTGTNFQQANLANSSLRKTILVSAILQQANLLNTNLQQADFKFANLKNANLTGANLQQTDLRFTNLQGLILEDANLKFAKVDTLDWFEILSRNNVIGIHDIRKNYFIHPAKKKDKSGFKYFIVRRIIK